MLCSYFYDTRSWDESEIYEGTVLKTKVPHTIRIIDKICNE